MKASDIKYYWQICIGEQYEIAEKSLNLINSDQNYLQHLLTIVLVTELDRPLHIAVKLQFKIISGFSVSKINVYQIG